MSYASDLARLWRSPGFRSLTRVRMLSQAGDGAFQFGIAATFFFDPTRGTTAADIAVGFAVMFAPFTLVGPFVGPLIDRWQRQRIVLVTNALRVVLVLGIGVAVVVGAPLVVNYVLALVTLSIHRFGLAAMAASIPRVVGPGELVAANSIQPTLGTVAATLGGATGGVVTLVAPGVGEEHRALIALAFAAVCFAIASVMTVELSPASLGPADPRDRLALGGELRALRRRLREGHDHLRERVTPWFGLLVMAAQRLLYGVMLVAAIVMARNLLAEPGDVQAGLAQLTLVLGFGAAGFGLAALVSPAVAPRIGPHRWILVCLGLGALGQLLLAVSPERGWLLAAAVVVSFAVQGGKISVDTIVQRDTDDAFRGRAFTLYDMAFNVAFIASAAVAALILPPDGYSRVVMAALAGVYLLVGVAFAASPRRSPAHTAAAAEPAP